LPKQKKLVYKLGIPIITIVVIAGLSTAFLIKFITDDLSTKITTEKSSVLIKNLSAEAKIYISKSDYDGFQIFIKNLKEKDPTVKEVYYVDEKNNISCCTSREMIGRSNEMMKTDEIDKIVWVSSTDFYIVSKVSIEVSEYLPPQERGVVVAYFSTEYYRNSMNKIVLIVLIAILLFLVTIAVFLFLFLNKKLNPLKKLVLFLDRIAKGDLKVECDKYCENVSNDEIGQVIKISTNMKDTLLKMVGNIDKVALKTGNLSEELIVHITQVGVFCEKIREFSTLSYKESEKLLNYINMVNEITDYVFNLKNNLMSNVMLQSESLTETSKILFSNIEKINNVYMENKEKSEKLKDLLEKVKESGLVFDKLLASTEGISTHTKTISELANMINAIAYKTNLLGMNAAIEAAHAREYGSGFAVVAEEIRKLSETVSGYSKSISSILIEITKTINSLLDNSKNAQNSLQYVFNSVSDMINETVVLLREIEEISKGTTLIRDTYDKVIDVTSNLNTSAKELDEKISQIKEYIKKLNDFVLSENKVVKEVVNSVNEINKSMINLKEIGIKNKENSKVLKAEVEKFIVS